MFGLTIITCLLLSTGILFIVMVKPLFWDKQLAYFDSDTEIDEFDETLSLLEAISELETDYKMGKISKEDFEAMSLEYKQLYLKETKSSVTVNK